jgi:hypothetical protein
VNINSSHVGVPFSSSDLLTVSSSTIVNEVRVRVLEGEGDQKTVMWCDASPFVSAEDLVIFLFGYKGITVCLSTEYKEDEIYCGIVQYPCASFDESTKRFPFVSSIVEKNNSLWGIRNTYFKTEAVDFFIFITDFFGDAVYVSYSWKNTLFCGMSPYPCLTTHNEDNPLHWMFLNNKRKKNRR